MGRVWITANAVDAADFAPPGAPAGPAGQVMCIEFADGSGMSTMLTEPFGPPGEVAVTTTSDDTFDARLVPIAVVGLAVIGISVLVFRADGRPPS